MPNNTSNQKGSSLDGSRTLQLSIFSSRVSSIADEMGAVLRRAAFSANIKDRLDYSCAMFDPRGQLIAQAAHIPVHLGSMAFAMVDLVESHNWQDGDTLVLNDPFKGGTHLPDVTLVSPVFVEGQLAGFVANRAHHADIGSEAPGSMPLSSSLLEEGVIISPTLMAAKSKILPEVFDRLTEKLGENSRGDFVAQWSANRRGIQRLQALIQTAGIENYLNQVDDLNTYARELAKVYFGKLPRGNFKFQDYLDDDGQGTENILLKTNVEISEGSILVDFKGSSAQVAGNLNCPLTVTVAAVLYVFRCLLPSDAPACHGLFQGISVFAPQGSILNADYPAAVAAGNVETSQRVVDLVLGALAAALPDLIPAASQGTMNNLAMGGVVDSENENDGKKWSYYETICGGTGAHSLGEGLDATQSHMTNTLNTPIEVLESNFPLRLRAYRLRSGSGGKGEYCGGEGVIREYEFLENTEVSLISERRTHQPWGLNGGGEATTGANYLNGENVGGKKHISIKPGDRLRTETPGGGGWGNPKGII